MLVKQRVKTNIFVAVVLAVVVGIFYSLQVHAESINTSTNTLKVSPVRTDIEIKPGESKAVKITVSNLTNEAIKVSPIENDFVAGDERGTPALVLDADQYAPTHSLKRFLKPIDDVTIPAKKAVTIEVVITVPKDAQAGGYFGAVRFAPTDPAGGGQVNLSASVASLILLTVPGDVVEKLNLTNFDVQQDGKSGTQFGSPDNLSVTARFENKGNLQAGPFGKISVKNGDKVVYSADFNDRTPRDMILPDSARRWDVPLQNIGTFGKYTVNATFTYGQDNQTIEVEKSFWVFPQWLIIAVIVGILVIIGLIVAIWFFLRNYRKRLLGGHAHTGGKKFKKYK